jgi:hypothetical protein
MPSSLPDFAGWIHWWARVYGNSTALSTTIIYIHLAGLLVGGGAAVATDRLILRAWRRGGAVRAACLEEVAAVHPYVVGGLLAIALSGTLMMLADWETFRVSRLFWGKMLTVGVLVMNGGLLTRFERLARRSEGRRGWPVLATASTLSLFLWLAVVGLGTWLKAAS